MSQHHFSEKPAEPQEKVEDAKAHKRTAERKGMDRKAERDHRKSYIFCRKCLTEHQLWQKYRPVLKQADQITNNNLYQLLTEAPSYRAYASDFNPKSPIRALAYCLAEINLNKDQLGKLMDRGPVAWICLDEIIRCFSRCADLKLRESKNIGAIIGRAEHIQPIANACILLTGEDSESEDALNHLGYDNFVLILQAGADAMETAVGYNTLLQQQPAFTLDSAILNLASDALPIQKLLDAQQTQDPTHFDAWLVLFAVLPGFATAHEAIYRCDKLNRQEKLLFLHQAIQLGTNIQAISKALDALCLNGFLTGPRLQQLFAFITQDKGQQIFIPSTLAEDIAQADPTNLSNLQKALAHQRYISSNFMAAKCLSDALVSACLAGILDTALYDTLLRKARHFTPIMGEALRFLADQPQGGEYAESCPRVLTKAIFNQILNSISPSDEKSHIAPDPQQTNQNVLKIVLAVMDNKKAFPVLNTKNYPHLHAYQMGGSSGQKSKLTEPVCSFFTSSSNLLSSQHYLLINHSSDSSSFTSSTSSSLISEALENNFKGEGGNNKSTAIEEGLADGTSPPTYEQ